jgi:ribonuclease P protein subunit POP4
MVGPENITKHELIGLKVKVLKSSNRDLVGIHGKIVDETRNMLIISTDEGEKNVAKDQATFEIELPDKRVVEVKGELLVGRPESRMKSSIPKTRV